MAKFVYHNVNPDGIKEEDCVCRAITLAMGKYSYQEIAKKLYHTGELLDCEALCMCCYKFLIENVFMCKPVNCDYMTVAEFADLHPFGTYLVRTNGHISVIIDGVCHDIWNCLHRELTNAWEVK